MDRLSLNLRGASRLLRTRKGSTSAIVTVLGLGVGFATTMFALADPFISRPLSYPSPEQLVVINTRYQGATRLPAVRLTSVPTIRDWRARRDLFQDVAYFDRWPSVVRVHEGGTAVRLMALNMGREALRILGQPEPSCESSIASGCALFTSAAQVRYGAGRRDFIGSLFQSATGAPLRVAGVLPRTFTLPSSFAPPADAILLVSNDTNHLSVANVGLLGRRQPGVSNQVLESALQATLGTSSGWTVTVESMSTAVTKVSRSSAVGALVAAVLILIVCVASSTNLLFSQGFHRLAEFATRKALGASRADLFHLVLIELTLLGVLVVGAGTGLAWVALLALRGVMPAQYLILGEPTVTLRIAVAAMLMTVATIGTSAVAASMTLRTQVAGSLSRPPGGAQMGRFLRFGIVATQSALAMILVTGTFVLGRSYFNLFSQDVGFARDAIVIAASYPTMANAELLQQIEVAVDHLRQVPGVERAGASSGRLIDGPALGAGASALTVGGVPFPGSSKQVTPDFFAAAGAQLISGRGLTPLDVNASGWVVNEAFAQANNVVLGDSVRLGLGLAARPGAVVGVVRDLFDSSLDTQPGAAIYRLLDEPISAVGGDTPVRFAVKAQKDAGDISHLLASAVTRGSPDVVVTDVSTIGDRLAGTVTERVFATLILSFFAVAAVTVCVAGLVGVVAFVTARRTRELAIRVAVGALPHQILRSVSADALTAACVGLVLGLVAVRTGSELLRAMTYQVELNTWAIGLPSGILMLLIVIGSVVVTARRALRLPLVAILRQE